MSVQVSSGSRRLGWSRGARVESDHLSVRRTVEEESHLDGNHESVPLGICQSENLSGTRTRRGTRLYFVPLCPSKRWRRPRMRKSVCGSPVRPGVRAAGASSTGCTFRSARPTARFRANWRSVANALSCWSGNAGGMSVTVPCGTRACEQSQRRALGLELRERHKSR